MRPAVRRPEGQVGHVAEVDARPDIGDDPVTGIFTAQEINLPGKITFLLDETRA
jgi:hypothetical protein